MSIRRNTYDVTDRIDTTQPDRVSEEVGRIHRALYGDGESRRLAQAFRELAAYYRGEHPDYRACDTAYHDIQHVMEVTLASARLMDGAVRSEEVVGLDARLFLFGIVVALFHDVGYLRNRKDTRSRNGAEYTQTHVSRGSRVLARYLQELGLPELADAGARVIHYTGYEMPVSAIDVDDELRLVGQLVGTADLVAQMADRCYLEKCHRRLYPEFVSGGLAAKRLPDGRVEIVYGDADDLVFKTAQFGRFARARLDHDLAGARRFMAFHFDGEDPYWEAVERNLDYAAALAQQRDVRRLRRELPVTLTV